MSSDLKPERDFENERVQRICYFKDTERRYTDFLIRLNYDGVRPWEFFRGVVSAYIEKDKNLMKFVDTLRDSIGRQASVGPTAKARRKAVAELEKELKERFVFSKEDRGKIFDILEKDMGEDDF